MHNLLAKVRVARFHVTHIHDGVNTLVERVFGGEFKWEKKKSKVRIRPRHQTAPELDTNHIN